MSQIIRDAIATETFLQETSDSGGKVLIKDKDDTLRESGRSCRAKHAKQDV